MNLESDCGNLTVKGYVMGYWSDATTLLDRGTRPLVRGVIVIEIGPESQ